MSADARDKLSPSAAMVAPQFLRYAGAGAIGTLAHYALLITLVQLAGVPAVTASAAGATIGALVNYVLNYRFTFASQRAHRVALPRFALVSILGIVLNTIVIAALLALARVHYVVAQVIATGVVLLVGFIVNRKWTF